MNDEQWEEIRPFAERVDQLRLREQSIYQMSGLSAYQHPCKMRLLEAIRNDARLQALANAESAYRDAQERVLGKVFDR